MSRHEEGVNRAMASGTTQTAQGGDVAAGPTNPKA
jgi:hypothetical protein